MRREQGDWQSGRLGGATWRIAVGPLVLAAAGNKSTTRITTAVPNATAAISSNGVPSDRTAAVNRTFIYPSCSGDPDAEAVCRSFEITAERFRSVLGELAGLHYRSRTSEGGFGTAASGVTFSAPCGFVVQRANGHPNRIETDRSVTAGINGRQIALQRYRPVEVAQR